MSAAINRSRLTSRRRVSGIRPATFSAATSIIPTATGIAGSRNCRHDLAGRLPAVALEESLDGLPRRTLTGVGASFHRPETHSLEGSPVSSRNCLRFADRSRVRSSATRSRRSITFGSTGPSLLKNPVRSASASAPAARRSSLAPAGDRRSRNRSSCFGLRTAGPWLHQGLRRHLPPGSFRTDSRFKSASRPLSSMREGPLTKLTARAGMVDLRPHDARFNFRHTPFQATGHARRTPARRELPARPTAGYGVSPGARGRLLPTDRPSPDDEVPGSQTGGLAVSPPRYALRPNRGEGGAHPHGKKVQVQGDPLMDADKFQSKGTS